MIYTAGVRTVMLLLITLELELLTRQSTQYNIMTLKWAKNYSKIWFTFGLCVLITTHCFTQNRITFGFGANIDALNLNNDRYGVLLKLPF